MDLKKTSGTQLAAKKIVKKYKNTARKKPYTIPPRAVDAETNNDEISGREDPINCLDDIAELQPSKKAQIAAKK